MPWPGAQFALLLLVATVGPPGASSEENVGCLFSERLCLEDEWCFDDLAFGRCLPTTSDVNEDDLFRYSLEKDVLHEISRELRRLFALGYRWSHGYTQCRLQAMLYATKHDLSFEANACSHLVDQDLEGALKALEGQDPIDPHEMAIVKYTPSDENPHADFADEVYYPPVDEGPKLTLREKILAPNAIDLDMIDPYAEYTKRGWIPQMHRRSLPPPSLSDRNLQELYPLIKYLNEMQLSPEEIQESLPAADYDRLMALLGQFEFITHPSERFTLAYNTPDSFRSGWESRDALNDIPESRIYFDENEAEPEDGSGEHAAPAGFFRELGREREQEAELFRALRHRQRAEQRPGIYTEGGVIYASQPESTVELSENELGSILAGFKRPERLDVKKPGPLFAPLPAGEKRAVPNSHKQYKEGLAAMATASTKEADSIVPDTDFVYVVFKNNVFTWTKGNQIIGNISNLLGLEPKTFTEGRVDRNEVTFKVIPNRYNLTSAQIAEKIENIREKLRELTGIEITKAGVGDRSKMTAIFAVASYDRQFYIILFTVCGILGAMITAAALLIIIKKNLKIREKLHGLARPDTEACKDYQDLCRARMAAKPQQETVHGRITSLSRESEQSPSSRSSTSSWSEEPALHNMDISTGHMVLTYMEDHLKNKDRLEQEWVALCAYVAEPCETSIGAQPLNAAKNRYAAVVPYDHARVVLNELSNIAGCDYINASSITDHDPRNPAYIASQGPLPHTAPDFWQLIWEQGAVVIVMLTRLTEGGTAMCHRYWPEEGSEVYHIYEVHLVSEHIWCDDYLVRSFYLKNIRTGETRTVTQFHFLSWPEAGVPASTKALLEFRRKVNKSYRGRSCPIVVHCSDGAGRTGTYCLIDMVLSRMAKGAKEIDIAATLEHLRDQRVKMVASRQQFEFVLTAVAEEVHAILKALPPPQEKEKEAK